MLWDDLVAARAAVVDLQAKLAAALAEVTRLEALAVKGGPDVSEFQGSVDFAKVKSDGYDFSFTRVLDAGSTIVPHLDTMYTTDRVNAIRAAGLTLGTYAFARVSNPANGERSAGSEAAMDVYLAEKAGALQVGDLPLVYDFENASLMGQTPAKAAAHLAKFIEVYKAIKGHLPIVYITPSVAAQVVPTMTAAQKTLLGQCPLWIAHWDVATPTVPAPWTSWVFWQYTSAGTVNGVTGKVDVNKFSGTKADLAALTIKNVVASTA